VLIGNAAIVGANDAGQGRALYLRYCASCHGANGEGNGPVAPALKTAPTNLRLLSDLYGKPLQEEKVARAIDGRAEIEAHGPRDAGVSASPTWHSAV
jgi:mono/diheme cytochrome c family protein